LTENLDENRISILKYSDRSSTPFQNESETITKTTVIPMPVYETQAELIWMIQDYKTREIIHSCRAQNRSPIRWDSNNDGYFNRHDVFYLPFIWKTSSNTLDANLDGTVNAYDLLLLLRRDL